MVLPMMHGLDFSIIGLCCLLQIDGWLCYLSDSIVSVWTLDVARIFRDVVDLLMDSTHDGTCQMNGFGH